MSEVLERNAKGQLLPGNQVGFTKDRQPLTNGRDWRASQITRDGATITLAPVVANAMILMENPTTPADVKLDAMKMILEMAFVTVSLRPRHWRFSAAS